jgi:hypothetical protein
MLIKEDGKGKHTILMFLFATTKLKAAIKFTDGI